MIPAATQQSVSPRETEKFGDVVALQKTIWSKQKPDP